MVVLATVVWRQLLHAIGPPQRETEYLVINIRCSKSLDAQSESENPTMKCSSSVKADTDINSALEISDQVQACKPMYIQKFGRQTGNDSSGK